VKQIDRLKRVLQTKQAMVDSLRARLEKRVATAQAELYDTVLMDLLKSLKLNKDGTIAATVSNIRTVDRINEIWEGFQARTIIPLVKDMASGYTTLGVLNRTYFIVFSCR
jgi:molecular chaperone GrpE (heat shock protein)